MSWRLNAGNETEVMDARGRNVARAHCGGAYGVKLDEAEAHARLIAAAPDMFAALEWWQAQMRDDSCDDMGALLDEMSAKAHAVIAKAKGDI
jgi:hypothetical protein